jgi:hypothetical protein
LDYVPAVPVEDLGESASRQSESDGLGCDIVAIMGPALGQYEGIIKGIHSEAVARRGVGSSLWMADTARSAVTTGMKLTSTS